MLDDFYQAEIKDDPTVKVEIDDKGDFYEVKYSKNKDFQAALIKASKVHKRKLGKKDPEGKFNQTIMAPLIAKHLLVNWRMTVSEKAKNMFFSDLQVTEVNDQPGIYRIPFSVENATKVLKKFQFQPLLNDIYDAAVNRSNFADEDLEDDVKN